MKGSRLVIALLGILCLQHPAAAQDSLTSLNRVLQFPDKIFSSLNNRTRKIEANMIRQSEKYLNRLARQERKLQRRLNKIDSNAARELFDGTNDKYDGLKKNLAGASVPGGRNFYSGHLDSMQTVLQFIEQNKLLDNSAAIQQQLQGSFAVLASYQQKLNQTERIRKIIQARQEFLKQRLEQFGLTRQFRKFQKDVYYYKAQIEEYRRTFEEPSMMERKLLGIAQHIPAFQKFFNKYAQLAGIFRLPGNDPMAGSDPIPGLQTRAMISQQLQDRLGTGPQADQYFAQQVSQAQSYLETMKQKAIGGFGNADKVDIPNFHPNSQRTKSFMKRLEWGTNIQSTRANSFFPVTTDFGLSMGYRISDKSVAGIGASYKMGWGKDIRHISISHQGIGFRSYLDIKLKGSFWISGGAEMNYRSEFKSFDILKDYSAWQQSTLLGISKRYSVGKKYNGELKLLYDFLYKNQVPRTQPIVFRVGYSLK